MGKITFIAKPGKQEIAIARMFKAPPECIFKAMSDPSLIRSGGDPENTSLS